MGNDRKFLAALITGDVSRESVAAVIERLNDGLPHYKRVRAYHIIAAPFTPEDGLLTANRKLRRGVIEERFSEAIEAMYREVTA